MSKVSDDETDQGSNLGLALTWPILYPAWQEPYVRYYLERNDK
jgi:hypothetical protein